MGKDPAVLFYTGDFLVGTMKMNYAQKGKYIQLLCLQHQDGHLSEDDMLDICGGYDEKIFSKFVKDDDGKYYNERMEAESVKRRKFVESRQKNFAKPEPKKIENSHTDPHIIPHMDSHMDNHTESRMENENRNINRDIFEYWNSKGIIKHRELNADINKAIEKALKSHSFEDIIAYIDRYFTVISDKNYFWHYKWSLKDFLSRKDGISAFTDEGSKWVSYCDFKKEPKPTTKKTTTVETPKFSTFSSEDALERALRRSYEDE